MTILLHDNQIGGRKKEIPANSLAQEFCESHYADPYHGPFERRFLAFLMDRKDDDGCIYFGKLSDNQWDALYESYKAHRDGIGH